MDVYCLITQRRYYFTIRFRVKTALSSFLGGLHPVSQDDALSQLVPADSIAKRSGPVRVVGIDLGTTNSTIAELSWSPDRPNSRAGCIEVAQNTAEGVFTNTTVPSVVALHEEQCWIGEGAKRFRAKTGQLGLRQNKDIFYDTKNEIGLDRTYHLAPQGYRSPTEIGSHILSFLADAAVKEGVQDTSRTVVTVPASFSISQRRETLRAAEMAGLKLEPGDLLDEPLAAFLDMYITRGPDQFQNNTGRKSLLVFDFGGGTCDVAIFKMQFASENTNPTVAPVAVSRYTRLGGGDIDAAIVFDVLIPLLLEQNNLATLDLSFDEKKNLILPALLGIAESLKIGISVETRRLIDFGRFEGATKRDIVKELSGHFEIQGKQRSFDLQSPAMTCEQFEDLLAPFLDKDLLYPRENEYRSSCSIFAPLSDATERAGMQPEEINYCLLVGGSSLIPQIQHAVADYFKNASILIYDELVDVQTAVAKGAAYHALMIEAVGHGLFRPVAHDDITILTSAGPVTLVRQNEPLPASTTNILTVPRSTLLEPCLLRVEISAGGVESRKILSSVWSIPGPVSQGDELVLSCKFDENQVLDLELRLARDGERPPFAAKVENPLTHVVNPQRARLKIDEREEALRNQLVPKVLIADEIYGLANAYVELGHREKAIEYLNQAMRVIGAPNAQILNRLGIISGELRDYERQEKYYREAATIESNGSPLFNLAYSQRQQHRLPDAAATIEQALAVQRAPEYLVLAGVIAREQERSEDARRFFEEARAIYPPIPSLTDFGLSWATRLSNELPDPEMAEGCRTERLQRNKSGDAAPSNEAMLPDLKGNLVRAQA